MIVPASISREFQCFLDGEDIFGGWNHRSLLRVAAVACIQHPGLEQEYLRRGLLALNARHLRLGSGGYHHTITCTWGQLVKEWLSQAELSDPRLWEQLEDELFDSRIPLRFYSQERLESEQAKASWVAPDRAPISLPVRLPPDLRSIWKNFCRQKISPENWTHRAHLEAARAALIGYRGQAGEVLKAGILRLNASHGIIESPARGYHETLTRSWIHLVCQDLTESGYWSTGELVPLSESLLSKETLFEYYTPERLKLHAARYAFLEPDLKELPALPVDFFSCAVEGIEKNSINLDR